jgi:ATP-dependent DNA helicase RecG
MLQITDPVIAVPQIASAYASRLKRLGIVTVSDLLYHYPVKYLDRSVVTPITQLLPDQAFTITATVLSLENIYTRYGKNLQKAIVTDATGQLQLIWFNQPFLTRAIIPGLIYTFHGKVKTDKRSLVMSSPDFEQQKTTASQQIHSHRLVPVYPETASVSSKWLRSRIYYVLQHLSIPDPMPESILSNNHLLNLDSALRRIHFPQNDQEYNQAKDRLSFDELFYLQLTGSLRRLSWQQQSTRFQVKVEQKILAGFIKRLPFKLTKAQEVAISDIVADLKQPHPMNRLLEGDVGSGKTVVAAAAMYLAVKSGYTSILMAPTEILANQHFKSLSQLFSGTGISVGLQTGSTKTKESHPVMIGTHALLYRFEKQDETALIIIDEQHRFGVEQRTRLEKVSSNPHRLTMSATPIPRTIALTLYGDLDISVLDELPKNRLPIKTWLVPLVKHQAAYHWVSKEIEQNKAQVYVVCPLIETSSSILLRDIKSAQAEYDRLKTFFPDKKINLLHGRMTETEKNSILTDFKSGKLEILVSTPVIEVGIDVPEATIIVIESAERFGLAQLHQLRGRVGRGDRPSYCLLFPSTVNKVENRRLKALTQKTSGFDLANLDLKIRGPGEVFGTQQHGFQTLKLAKLSNVELINQTKQAADQLIKSDPTLNNHPLLKQQITIPTVTVTSN